MTPLKEEKTLLDRTEDKLPELFTKEERRRIVRSFIEGYIAGSVSITWLTEQDLNATPELLKAEKKKFPLLETMNSTEMAMALKSTVLTTIETAAGSVAATVAEQQFAIDQAFRHLLSLRSIGLIQGEFLQTPKTESRLADLEDAVAKQKEKLIELEILLKNLLGPSSQ